jgi:hypothetical protein
MIMNTTGPRGEIPNKEKEILIQCHTTEIFILFTPELPIDGACIKKASV